MKRTSSASAVLAAGVSGAEMISPCSSGGFVSGGRRFIRMGLTSAARRAHAIQIPIGTLAFGAHLGFRKTADAPLMMAASTSARERLSNKLIHALILSYVRRSKWEVGLRGIDYSHRRFFQESWHAAILRLDQINHQTPRNKYTFASP